MRAVTLLVALTLATATVVAIAACKSSSDCEKACKRVAACRQEARVGKKMLGERDLPPDARCMKRCTQTPDEWEKCEYKQRTCSALRSCYGPLR